MEVRREFDHLEQKDALKDKKIKMLQEENQRLAVNLQEKNLSFNLRDSCERTADEAIKAISSPSLTGSICLSASESMDNFMLSEADKTFISEKIEEISKLHKD